jgi:hypothetical protein
MALSLMSAEERQRILGQFKGNGESNCVVRLDLDDANCESLFFDAQGNLRPETDYLEIGRAAMCALLDPDNDDIAKLRTQMLVNPRWQKVLEAGASPELDTMLPIPSTDSRFQIVQADVRGDVFQIFQWAHGMRNAGQALQEMRAFLADRDPVSLKDDPDFKQHRDRLQSRMTGVVSGDQVRFNEPWGIVSLFHAARTPNPTGYLKAANLLVQRGATNAG